MAICSTCKVESSRIRVRWNANGEQLPDECPHCAPDSFERFTAPSDKKIWMGYEAHPNEYVKAEDGGFDRKPEYRAEQEHRLAQETEEEKNQRLAAEAKKRRERRTTPMDAAELAAALCKGKMISDWVATAAENGIDIN